MMPRNPWLKVICVEFPDPSKVAAQIESIPSLDWIAEATSSPLGPPDGMFCWQFNVDEGEEDVVGEVLVAAGIFDEVKLVSELVGVDTTVVVRLAGKLVTLWVGPRPAAANKL